MTWSNAPHTSSLGWWIVDTTVTPPLARSPSASMTSMAMPASSPVVGSSRSRRLGQRTSVQPMKALRFSPPLRPRISVPPVRVPPMRESRTWRRRRVLIAASTVAAFSCCGMDAGRLRLAYTVSTSTTVSVTGSTMSWVTYPVTAPARGGSWPVRVPVVCRRARESSRLVLPPPEGPMIAHTVPTLTRPLIDTSTGSWRAGTE
mmetsp:Transcript_23496/g.80011  ORF Transcript_23496/g.80011 Transcript_23496/m.80011 type:complete len:203 (-) Transcript_23496:243-851(-)